MDNRQPIVTQAGDVSPGSAVRPPGAIASVCFGIALTLLLVWQFTSVSNDGIQLQVLDPSLALYWKIAIVAPVAISTLCSSVVWMRRTWTMPLAVVNTAANWVAAVVIVALALDGVLFAPPAPVGPRVQDDAASVAADLTEVFVLLVIAAAIWDSLDGLRWARHGAGRRAFAAHG